MLKKIDQNNILPALVVIVSYISILTIIIYFILRNYQNSILVFILSVFLSIWIFIPFKVVIQKLYLIPKVYRNLLKDFNESISDKTDEKSNKKIIEKIQSFFIDPIMVTLVLLHIVGCLIISLVFFKVEGLISGHSQNVIRYFFFFFLSGIITFLFFRVYYLISYKFISIGFFIAGYWQSIKIARISMLNFKPFDAYNIVEVIITILLTAVALIAPLMITFSEKTNLNFYFFTNLTLCLLIIPFYIYQFRKQPIQYMIELVSYIIPVQLSISLFVGFITFSGYIFMYYLRLWLSQANITFPFNIPLVFNDVFLINPVNLNFIAYIEVIIFSLIISAFLAWVLTVLYKRSWVELAAGIGISISLFGIPLFQKSIIYNEIEKLLGESLSYVPSPAFLVATLLPFIIMWIVKKVRDFAFSKTTTCYNCFFDDLKIYSNFCPFCGAQQVNTNRSASEVSKIFEERRMKLADSQNTDSNSEIESKE